MSGLHDGIKAAFSATGDTVRQLVTLQTALLAGFVAAVKANFVSLEQEAPWVVGAFIISALLCVIFSFWTQLALAGTLDATANPARSSASTHAARTPSVYNLNVRLPLAATLITFLISLAALGWMTVA
jgi:hypothetical protein